MKSIRTKIILSIVLCALLPSLAIGVLSIVNVSKVSNESAEKTLMLSCENQCTEINTWISGVEQSVDALYQIAMSSLEFDKFQKSRAYVTQYTGNLTESVTRFAENTDGVICAYVRYNPEIAEPTSGLFLTRSSTDEPFTSTTPTDFSMYDKDDTEHVGWYYIPVENGAPIWMNPYLNANVNIYMISYVIPMYVDGVSVGIIGMDIDFSQMTQLVDEVTAFETGYAFLYNNQAEIMNHPVLEHGADMTQVEDGALLPIMDELLDDSMQGTILQYTYGEKEKSLAFYSLHNGMKMALTVPDDEVQKETNTLTTSIMVFIIVCLVISILLGVIIGNSIAAPIRKVTDVIERMSRLDFHFTPQQERLAKRRDETGVMVAAVNEMAAVLRELIEHIGQIEENILENMNRLDQVMQENNAISEDNSATTEELAAGMEETTASTVMMTGNANAVKQSADDIRQLSGEGQEISAEIKERARKLRETTKNSSDRAMKIYGTMKQQTEEAVERSKAVAKINELTDDIRQISSQTNLLALNANIEAARAGEAGRGFAVVATEIGNLAGQTFQTVDSINQIVEEVNDAVSNMTDCIAKIMDFLNETVVTDYDSFQEVGEQYEADANTFASSMTQVYQEVNGLNQKIGEITEIIDNVSITIGQSAEGVNLIAEKSSDAVAKTSEGYRYLQESRDCVERLRAIMEKFVI